MFKFKKIKDNKNEIIIGAILSAFILGLFYISSILGTANIFAIVIFGILIAFFVRMCLKRDKKEEKERPIELNEHTISYKNEIEKAWKYANAADKRIQQRLNYFMLAESMLLLSYVTAVSNSDKSIGEIPTAIAFAGIIITFIWFIPNIRLLIQSGTMEKYLLKKDPIYYDHIKSVRRHPNTTFFVHNILPSSIIVLWAYLFHNSLHIISIYEFSIKLLPFWLLVILGIKIIMKYYFPK